MSAWGPVMYRVYDEQDRLIYIGSTGDFDKRLTIHAKASWWFELAHRFDLEQHPHRLLAHRAETLAISGEAPAFNINSLGVSPPKQMILTAEEQRVLRAWAEANPSCVSKLPRAFRWALDAAGVAA